MATPTINGEAPTLAARSSSGRPVLSNVQVMFWVCPTVVVFEAGMLKLGILEPVPDVTDVPEPLTQL